MLLFRMQVGEEFHHPAKEMLNDYSSKPNKGSLLARQKNFFQGVMVEDFL